jgi:hypothetical protein
MKKSISIFTFLSLAAVAGFVLADQGGDRLIKINEQRLPMNNRAAQLCRSFTLDDLNPHEEAAEVDIYVNSIVADYRAKHTDKFDYPIGSKFVKHKYSKIRAKDPDLATIMLKTKNEGSVDDWEFSMISLPNGELLAQSKTVSCASCHEKYEERGYISKKSEAALQSYLKKLKTIEAK